VRGATYCPEKNGRGRKDSNPRPSVLEFPASILPASLRAAPELERSTKVDGSRSGWLYMGSAAWLPVTHLPWLGQEQAAPL
jgi:hypothetical protein